MHLAFGDLLLGNRHLFLSEQKTLSMSTTFLLGVCVWFGVGRIYNFEIFATEIEFVSPEELNIGN
jgi:hypothetical protein